MYWQGETDAQCSPFRDAASSLLASREGRKRELIGSSTPTSTLDASHSRLAGTCFADSGCDLFIQGAIKGDHAS